MNLSATHIFWGLLIFTGSVFIVRRFKKRWVKFLICALGTLIAGVTAFYPAISDRLHSPKLPTDAEILALLYGSEIMLLENPDGTIVYISEQLSAVEKEQFHYAAQVNTQIVHKQRGREHNPQQIIVLTKTGPPDCCDRSFLPVLGSAIIVWDGKTWQTAAHQKFMIPFYGFELLSEAKIIDIGPQKTALVVQDKAFLDDGAQSWNLVITFIDGHLKPVAKIETLANNENQCPPLAENEPCWSYTSNYDFIPGNHSDYYDMQVTKSGTKPVNGVLVSVKETDTYVFSEGEYQIEGN